MRHKKNFTPIDSFISSIRPLPGNGTLRHNGFSHQKQKSSGGQVEIVAIRINDGGYSARLKTRAGVVLSPGDLTDIPPGIKTMIKLK